MMSRCSSPMPAMIVSLVSGSVKRLKVGSSFASLASASDSLSRSPRDAGRIDIEMTVGGNCIDSRTIGSSFGQSVSPVEVTLRPTAAPIWPASSLSIGSRLLACISMRREMRSRSLRTGFHTRSPAESVPE